MDRSQAKIILMIRKDIPTELETSEEPPCREARCTPPLSLLSRTRQKTCLSVFLLNVVEKPISKIWIICFVHFNNNRTELIQSICLHRPFWVMFLRLLFNLLASFHLQSLSDPVSQLLPTWNVIRGMSEAMEDFSQNHEISLDFLFPPFLKPGLI